MANWPQNILHIQKNNAKRFSTSQKEIEKIDPIDGHTKALIEGYNRRYKTLI